MALGGVRYGAVSARTPEDANVASCGINGSDDSIQCRGVSGLAVSGRAGSVRPAGEAIEPVHVGRVPAPVAEAKSRPMPTATSAAAIVMAKTAIMTPVNAPPFARSRGAVALKAIRLTLAALSMISIAIRSSDRVAA